MDPESTYELIYFSFASEKIQKRKKLSARLNCQVAYIPAYSRKDPCLYAPITHNDAYFAKETTRRIHNCNRRTRRFYLARNLRR